MFPTAHLAPRRLPALPSHRWLLGLGLALGGILLMATTGRVYALAPRSSDTTPATVTITSPEDGATVSGTILVTASASDNVGVVRVRFRLDGVNLGARDTSAPYAVSWNTTTASNGPHTLTAVARDAAGNTTTSAPITVTVSSPVTSPGTVTDLRVTTTASDGITLAFTEANDGTGNPAKYDVRYAAGTTTWGSASDVSSGTCSAPLLGTTIGATKSCTVLGLAPSTLYQFQLVAFRGTLNIDAVFGDLSNIVGATTPSLADTIPPTASITSPASGATVSGTTFTVSANASDNVGVVGVQFKLDGADLGAEDTTVPYSVSWNTTTASNGPHTLTAVARDAAGNTTTSAPITVTVSSPVTSPGTVTDLRVTTTASDGITLAFTEANDGTGNPAKYDVRYAAGTTTWGSASDVSSGTCSAPLLGTTIGATKSCTVLGLAPSTLYQFQLVAFRGTLNIDAVFGDLSNIVGATTPSLADTIPPTASITSPASGATVSGTTFTVSANASDNVGVVGVQFKLDGANLGVEDTTGPYAISWNTTTASDGTHTLTAVARDSAGNQTVSGVTVTVSNTSAPPSPKGGIAARYPGDVGIEADPNVIFVERFDEATLTDLFGRWTDILNGPAMQFSTDVPPGSPGSRSLNIPWVGGGVNNGGHLYKQLIPGVGDTLYVRYYIKYPTSGTYQHTGVWMGGHNPPLPWPDPQAGLKPAGNDRFSAAAEQNPLTSRFDHYNYWMGMHQSADGNFWGNVLLNDPTVQARTGQWMCVEHMVKLNNPTTSLNGEHAIWLDGVNVSHLGQGFPNGSWTGGIFTQNPTGVPFEGFSWRSDATLNINWIWLQNYASTDPAGFSGTMKFAHVVTAKSYIGCLTSGSSDTTPPTVSVTAPAVGAIVSGSTVTVSATASDNVGVVGVQFTLDGANLGVEDAAATYSKSWNTTTVSNGLHTLSAVARDAAGNTTASAAVTVTVSNLLSSAWPNEPTGLTVLVDWGLDLAVPTAGDVPILGSPGWNVVGNAVPGSAQGWAQLALDPSAPVSPANVYDFVYPAGMIEGEAPATVYYNLAAGEMYAGFWWKPSSPFDTGPNGNKIAFLFNGGGGAGGQQFLILMPDGRLHVLPEYPGDFRWRTPNVNATLVTLGQWHRIEWYCQLSTGTLKWWLDGVLQGSYTDVRNSHSFDMFQFSPTWGGNSGARKRETDHYWFDQVHLSVR